MRCSFGPLPWSSYTYSQKTFACIIIISFSPFHYVPYTQTYIHTTYYTQNHTSIPISGERAVIPFLSWLSFIPTVIDSAFFSLPYKHAPERQQPPDYFGSCFNEWRLSIFLFLCAHKPYDLHSSAELIYSGCLIVYLLILRCALMIRHTQRILSPRPSEHRCTASFRRRKRLFVAPTWRTRDTRSGHL